MNTDTKNLQALVRILADSAESEHAILAEPSREALNICEGGYAVYAATHFQLQAALASIRDRRLEDAVRYINLALGVQANWVGASAPSTERPSTAESVDRSPRASALRLIGATLIILPAGVVTIATWPIAHVHNRANALLEALWREILRPS